MSYLNPLQIGILPCPGGLCLGERIIEHLHSISSEQLEKKIELLSQKYQLTKDEVATQICIYKDFIEPEIHSPTIPETFNNNFRVDAKFIRFANGEFKTEILSSIRGIDVFIIQDVANQYPIPFNDGNDNVTLSINDHIFCLLVTVDAVLQAGARRVTVVLPCYPYARQHKKKRREGLTAARFGQIMEFMGVDRIITLDIHSKEVENTFNHLRLENLHGSFEIIKELDALVDLNSRDIVVVSPDTGSIDRNKFYAHSLNKPLGLIYKERDYSKVSKSARDSNIVNISLLGDIKGKTVFLCDDMLGTGGTLLGAVSLIKEMGAKKIICAVSLPLFSGKAIEHFDDAYEKNLLYRVIGTNAIFHDKFLLEKEWYIQADISCLFAHTIYKLHHGQSVSALLDNRDAIKALLNKKPLKPLV